MNRSRILLLFLFFPAFGGFSLRDKFEKSTTLNHIETKPNEKFVAFKEKADKKGLEAKSFIKKNNFNQDICFLLDMSLPSGQSRFFIYDLKKDSILNKALVAHGNCFEFWLETPRYSNVVGSGCTSLGRYRVGKSYVGKFGYSYKLHGLDSTNNNAYERTVVLHSHSCIPDEDISDEICQSNGCPTVSPSFLQQLKTRINRSEKTSTSVDLQLRSFSSEQFLFSIFFPDKVLI